MPCFPSESNKPLHTLFRADEKPSSSRNRKTVLTLRRTRPPIVNYQLFGTFYTFEKQLKKLFAHKRLFNVGLVIFVRIPPYAEVLVKCRKLLIETKLLFEQQTRSSSRQTFLCVCVSMCCPFRSFLVCLMNERTNGLLVLMYVRIIYEN